MATARRRYDAKTRAKASGIAVVEGVTEAERQTGIPKETIHYWTKTEFAHLRTTAREVVVDQFWIALQVGLREVLKGISGEAPLKEKSDALRTIADRYALLTGSATSRTENRELNDLPDSAYVEAIREYQSILGRSSTDGSSAEEPAG